MERMLKQQVFKEAEKLIDENKHKVGMGKKPEPKPEAPAPGGTSPSTSDASAPPVPASESSEKPSGEKKSGGMMGKVMDRAKAAASDEKNQQKVEQMGKRMLKKKIFSM